MCRPKRSTAPKPQIAATAVVSESALVYLARHRNVMISLGMIGSQAVLSVVAGFVELSFNSMAQTLVQMNAPTDIRGRVLGVFSMMALGLRSFSGVTVGLMGAAIGIHVSLALSALALLSLSALLLVRSPKSMLAARD